VTALDVSLHVKVVMSAEAELQLESNVGGVNSNSPFADGTLLWRIGPSKQEQCQELVTVKTCLQILQTYPFHEVLNQSTVHHIDEKRLVCILM
jgi:hypothetical protein